MISSSTGIGGLGSISSGHRSVDGNEQALKDFCGERSEAQTFGMPCQSQFKEGMLHGLESRHGQNVGISP